MNRLSGDMVRRDLVADPLPHVTSATMSGNHPVSGLANTPDPAAHAASGQLAA